MAKISVPVKVCEKHFNEAKDAKLPIVLFIKSQFYCFKCNHLKNKKRLK